MKRLLPIFLACAFLIFALSGCAHVVSKDLRDQVDKRVNVEDMFAHPAQYEGKTVMLGGVIIQTKVLEDGSEIVALEKPLDQQGRPRDTDLSRGRFIVHHPDQLDPAIFSPWREITVVGVVTGYETRKLDEAEFTYLTLDAKAVYILKGTAADRHIPVSFGLGVFQSF